MTGEGISNSLRRNVFGLFWAGAPDPATAPHAILFLALLVDNEVDGRSDFGAQPE